MPFRRSLTLCLGLFGLIFLPWSWVDSTNNLTTFGLPRLETNHLGGALHISIHPNERVHPFLNWTEFAPSPSKPPYRLASPHIATRANDISVGLPHWLLILLYLILWSIALALRHRRIQRSLTKHLSSSPAQPQTVLNLRV